MAHRGKTVGGGLEELRAALADGGFADPPWIEIDKSKQAPKAVGQLVEDGVDLLVVWGGDGTVQRCVDAVVRLGAAASTTIAVIPAGTANLLAGGLGVPNDVRAAVAVALRGTRRLLDVGRINGEHFTVMAGTGFDALLVGAADRGLKDRLGPAAYVWTGWRQAGSTAAEATVSVDGAPFFRGRATCVLVSNIGTLIGGVRAFPDALPDDGLLDVGVIQAETRAQWLQLLARAVMRRGPGSPLVQVTTARRSVRVRLDRTLPWELDGGERPRTDRLKIKVLPRAITVCVPDPAHA